MAAIERLIALFEIEGQQAYIGEPVSQWSHASQAAEAALGAGASEAVILSALLHDIGHLQYQHSEKMGRYGVRGHERLGAYYLNTLGFSSVVAELVGLHVDAKRYRVAKDASYAGMLSPASKRTLAFQGGAMTPLECKGFESSPFFCEALQLRQFDEAAKRVQRPQKPLVQFEAILSNHLQAQRLDDRLLLDFHALGFAVLKRRLPADAITLLIEEISTLAAHKGPARWMTYFEQSVGGASMPCRIEYLLDDAPRLSELLEGPAWLNLASQCLGEPAVLFKEKINFKLPGGRGFKAHQDAPAFDLFGQSEHVTIMLSLDPSTLENGCLEVGQGSGRQRRLPQAADLTLDAQTEASLSWLPQPTDIGDVMIFDGFLPHRSGANQTNLPRRAIYATYAKAREGDHRETYFRRKRLEFPPEQERVPGRDYPGGVFNVGNPIR